MIPLTAIPILHDFGKAWDRWEEEDYKYDDNGVGEKPPSDGPPNSPH